MSFISKPIKHILDDNKNTINAVKNYKYLLKIRKIYKYIK